MTVEVAFWAMALLVAYVYAGYPLVLALAEALRRSPRADARSVPESLPKVTLLISAYNEAACIEHKLANALALDYPADRLEIIVVSDASDDGTDAIVEGWKSRGVQLLRMPKRGGKTLGLNAGVAASTGEIVVFSDANALYRPNAIRALVAPFSDPEAGTVIGESTYTEASSPSGRSESLYWSYEVWIKALESRGGSVVGGDGAICAVRRSLYEPMAADALSDFVNPLQIVRAGYRCIYQPDAVSYEEAAPDFEREYRRKVRIVNRAWRALWSMRELLNPLKHGTFALKLWSHKVLRWWVPLALAALFLTNLALLGSRPIYSVSFAAQAAFYALAALGFLTRRQASQPSLLRIPFYFCLVNIAAGVGIAQAMLGKTYTTWTTARAS